MKADPTPTAATPPLPAAARSLIRGARVARTGNLLAAAAVGAFVLCMTQAMLSYPGGSIFDSSRPGYDFWQNFWCDLLRQPALNGEPNPTAPIFAQISIWALGAGLFPFFLALAEQSGASPRLQRVIAGLGAAGVVGMLGVAFLPSNRFPVLHGLLVTTAGPAGIAAALFAFVAALRVGNQNRNTTILGLTTLGFSVLNLAQYAREFYLNVPSSPALPAVQKLATLSLLGWMLVTTRLWQIRHERGG